MDTEKIAGLLKIDETKIYEALPAMAIILEKAEVLDLVQEIMTSKRKGEKLNSFDASKIVIRIISRMGQYKQEFDDAIKELFGVDAETMSSKERMQLLQKILVEQDIADFS